ncbi:LysR family transcriptional regulator [Alkalihalobacillus sp. 1P02AB]|uniref:LysR family transcriptional regulator n=1 Tax=Alkalihalobacillus sp. 1P02AB TaxID=3132260 RepID=UPI0039A6AE33
MDIKQVRCFLEVCSQLSFSRASQKLHLSQSALSKIIQSMEDELGIKLFDRSTRHLYITDEGKAIIPYAKRLLLKMEDFMKVASEQHQATTGHVKFGLPPVIGSSFFPSVIAQFRKAYPGIELEIVEEGSRIVEQKLLDGQLDVGVAILPLDKEKFEVQPIIERKLKLVLPKHHRFALQKAVKLKDLKDEEFLMFSRGFTLYDRVRDACIKAGFEPIVVQESSQWDFMIKMVSVGNGICVLPETICEHVHLYDCTAVDLIEPVIEWNLALIRRKDSYLFSTMKTWMEFVSVSLKNQQQNS